MGLLIRHAKALHDGVRFLPVAPVGVESGKVQAIGTEATGGTTMDAHGLVVAPGLVDIHVHFREPGQESKEDIASGARAAAKGGFTTVVTMANTMPRIDNAGMVEFVHRRARETACIHIRPAACATKGMKGEELTEMAELKDLGVVAVTDDGLDIPSSAVMRRVLEYARMVGLPYLAHCEDEALARGGAMNEGFTSARLGIPGIPRAAEEIRIDRNIRLAELAGAHIHIQHVTTREGVNIIRAAKARGVRVTAEVCPHHFTLTDEAVATFNSNAKMNPPLREQDDLAALIEGIQDGTIDCIATDHAPHTPTEKGVEFENAPFGILGLETALALTITELVRPGHITLERAITLLSAAPARICHLEPAGRLAEGGPADLVLFDPDEEWTITPADFASKSSNTPFLGRKVYGRVKYTICGGEVVYRAAG
jgi:dihydroorotase